MTDKLPKASYTNIQEQLGKYYANQDEMKEIFARLEIGSFKMKFILQQMKRLLQKQKRSLMKL